MEREETVSALNSTHLKIVTKYGGQEKYKM
jgi:hypothetical protein